MLVEGIIGKEHMRLMEQSGYEFDWKIEDEAQAADLWEKQGIKAPEEMDFSASCYVRFWLDACIEDYIPADLLVDDLPKEDLPLWINCKDKEILEVVRKRMKEEFANGRT